MTATTEPRLGPTTDTKTITSSSVGMLIRVSVARMINWSTRPPNRPAIPPRIVPIMTYSATAPRPDDQRCLGAVTQPGPHVAAGAIRPEDVDRARAACRPASTSVKNGLSFVTNGRQRPPSDDDDQQDHGADHGQPVTQEAAQAPRA